MASLSLGGAERIVLDWAARVSPRWRVHLVVLRDARHEWAIPDAVRVTRLHGRAVAERLREIGRAITATGNPSCVCHLLEKAERDALAEGGAHVVPVLHNAEAGWLEDASRLRDAPQVVAVSEACARDLRQRGYAGEITVIRHIPRRSLPAPGARERLRRQWNVPIHASVIGMVGAVKPQKNYPMALRLLAALLQTRDAYLVILGGPVGRDGRRSWEELLQHIQRLGVRNRVAMPGFVPHAASCLAAFDLLLNTSLYEGLSMATLEALSAGLPVVASDVGGQGEMPHEGLTLVQPNAPDTQWVAAIELHLGTRLSVPVWADFPSYRQWTLVGLARPSVPANKVLFVTANLNAGGAQRSLVNLIGGLGGALDVAVAVAGRSTSDHFHRALCAYGVEIASTGHHFDPFAHAEMLVAHVGERNGGTLCFWNVDARVKLLVVKALAWTGIRFVDVSPGDDLYHEMNTIEPFARMVAFPQERYWRRLDALVLKYPGVRPPECEDKTVVVPNGVPTPLRVKTDYALRGDPRVVMSGRIAPAKFVVEVIDAMRILWKRRPATELHVLGTAEHYNRDYAKSVMAAAGCEIDRRVFFHGSDFAAPERLVEFDAFVVLGRHQGCPNALLEAMAAGVPAVANDDGGTRELVRNGETGLLVASREPAELAASLSRLLDDRALAGRLAGNARSHVRDTFGMDRMVRAYTKILQREATP